MVLICVPDCIRYKPFPILASSTVKWTVNSAAQRRHPSEFTKNSTISFTRIQVYFYTQYLYTFTLYTFTRILETVWPLFQVNTRIPRFAIIFPTVDSADKAFLSYLIDIRRASLSGAPFRIPQAEVETACKYTAAVCSGIEAADLSRRLHYLRNSRVLSYAVHWVCVPTFGNVEVRAVGEISDSSLPPSDNIACFLAVIRKRLTA